MLTLREKIRLLMAEGVYDQNDLFRLIYPTYKGHYSVLRAVIAEEKNNA